MLSPSNRALKKARKIDSLRKIAQRIARMENGTTTCWSPWTTGSLGAIGVHDVVRDESQLCDRRAEAGGRASFALLTGDRPATGPHSWPTP